MLNGDLETDFDVDESPEVTLRIRHDGETANRPKITAQALNSTSFAARLKHVQYGKWRDDDAVLLGFNFEFRFPHDSSKRMTAATIRLTLEATEDASFAKAAAYDPSNDPQIVLLAPGRVRGEFTQRANARHWSLQVPAGYNFLGLQVGVEGSLGQDINVETKHSMSINGFSDGDSKHDEDNVVVWVTQENSVQKSGILHRFPAALVARLPDHPQKPVKLSGMVTPTVAFSVNPLRLLQKKDDPVFLDTSTPKGQPFAPGLDFSSKDFPWSEVVNIPDEYSDQLTA